MFRFELLPRTDSLNRMPFESAQPSDSDPVAELRPTSWAVLGLLCFGYELSGYDMKKWADHSLRHFYWSPSYSQIYSELKRLEEQGLASSRVVSMDDVRGKRLYSVTTKGRDAVRRWVNDAPVEPVVLKNSVLLRLWLGHLGQPEALKSVLRAHRDQTDVLRRRAQEHADNSVEVPEWAFPELVLRSAVRHYDSEIERIDEMLASLEEVSTRSRNAFSDEDAPPRPFEDLKLPLDR